MISPTIAEDGGEPGLNSLQMGVMVADLAESGAEWATQGGWP